MPWLYNKLRDFTTPKSSDIAETRGKWLLRKGEKTETGLKSSLVEANFVVNPQRVTITPTLRVSIEDTLDGKAISPWVDPESGTNIGSIAIRMEGNKPIYPETEQGQANTAALLRLYNMSLDGYLKERDGVLVQDIWQLSFITPVFSNRVVSTMAGANDQMIVLLGYMTQPMVITESAQDPFYPSWSMTFEVYGGQIKTFREVLGIGIVG